MRTGADQVAPPSLVRENETVFAHGGASCSRKFDQVMYACFPSVGLPVIAGCSLPPMAGATIAGGAQVRPPLLE
jgi:hypothetical protein